MISIVEFLYIFCWFVMKKYTKTWAPFVIIPYTFAICVTTVLIFFDVIPVSSKETHAYNLIFCLQNVNVSNCCNFLINVLVWAPMLIIAYSMQLIATQDSYFDPYTGVKLMNEQQTLFFFKHMSYFILMVILAMSRVYISQRA